MESKNAIIVFNNGQYEARCRNCGKLLFTYTKKCVDISKQNVIIVSRCTRSDCKADNVISL